MGHIEYFEQYAPQPIAFRDGGNPGKHIPNKGPYTSQLINHCCISLVWFSEYSKSKLISMYVVVFNIFIMSACVDILIQGLILRIYVLFYYSLLKV